MASNKLDTNKYDLEKLQNMVTLLEEQRDIQAVAYYTAEDQGSYQCKSAEEYQLILQDTEQQLQKAKRNLQIKEDEIYSNVLANSITQSISKLEIAPKTQELLTKTFKVVIPFMYFAMIKSNALSSQSGNRIKNVANGIKFLTDGSKIGYSFYPTQIRKSYGHADPDNYEYCSVEEFIWTFKDLLSSRLRKDDVIDVTFMKDEKCVVKRNSYGIKYLDILPIASKTYAGYVKALQILADNGIIELKLD